MKSGINWLPISLLLIAVGGGLSVYGWKNATLLRALAREGVTTEGKVIDHVSGQYSRRSSHYSLTVEFTPEPHALRTNVLTVDGRGYRVGVQTGRIPVRYLPEDPGFCSAGDVAILPFQVVGVFGSIICLAGLAMVWHARRPAASAPRPV